MFNYLLTICLIFVIAKSSDESDLDDEMSLGSGDDSDDLPGKFRGGYK